MLISWSYIIKEYKGLDLSKTREGPALFSNDPNSEDLKKLLEVLNSLLRDLS